MKWYRKAAEQGYALAQWGLGNMYSLGRGVPQDYVPGHMWNNLAASSLPTGKQPDLAAEARDLVGRLMTPAQISEAQKLARE